MDIYLSSPNSQMQAFTCQDMNVLISFPLYSNWLGDYVKSFDKVMIDSGAYTEFNTGKKIDVIKYKDWSQQWLDRAEAITGLDDINGDWKKSWSNYKKIEWSFPVFHESDPIEFLDDCIAMALERKTWLGIGLIPPRTGKEKLLRDIIEKIPREIHIHGFALRGYSYLTRFNSFDSTNWFLDAMQLKKQLDYLTYGECLELIIKRYKRYKRKLVNIEHSKQLELF